MIFETYELRENRYSLGYPLLNLVRRIVFAFSIVGLARKGQAQTFIYIVSSLVMLSYLGRAKPFKDLNYWRIMLFNETMVLCSGFVMLGYTPFVIGLDTGLMSGIVFIMIIAFVCLINFIAVCFELCLSIRQAYRKYVFNKRLSAFHNKDYENVRDDETPMKQIQIIPEELSMEEEILKP